MSAQGEPLVAIVMGSTSDLPTMRPAAETLRTLQVPFEMRVLSAHRAPAQTLEYGQGAAQRGLKVIIAGAGGAAHLAGVLAAVTTLPVLGVPIPSRALRGLDSLLSIVQMPGGVPVGTLGIGKSGATNAALLAVAILGLEDAALAARYRAYRENQTRRVQQEPPLELTAEAPCLSMKRR